MDSDVARQPILPLIVSRAMAVGLQTPELGFRGVADGLSSEMTKAMTDPTRDEQTECGLAATGASVITRAIGELPVLIIQVVAGRRDHFSTGLSRLVPSRSVRDHPIPARRGNHVPTVPTRGPAAETAHTGQA